MVAVAATTVGLGGCATNTSTLPHVTNVPPLGLTLRMCDSGTPNCAGEANFSLGSLRDLQVNADWQKIPGGTHTQEIAFLLRNGVVEHTVSHGFDISEG